MGPYNRIDLTGLLLADVVYERGSVLLFITDSNGHNETVLRLSESFWEALLNAKN